MAGVLAALSAFLAQALHLALMLAAAPLLTGLVRLLKARILGRRGPPLLQPYRDLWKLMRKQPVVAANASSLFRLAPYLHMAFVLAGIALVPSFANGMSFAPLSDLVVIIGILAAARAIVALAAMDVGTAFGGLGASREMTFAVLAEPAMLMVVFIFALLTGTTQLDLTLSVLRDTDFGVRVSLALALIAMVAIAIAENARISVDNPATHLELTMVHEAMVLEYSGRHLALIEAAAMLRLLFWMSLIGVMFFPYGLGRGADPLGWPLGLALWGVKVLVLAAALALFECAIAKMRVFRVTEFLGTALLVALLGAIFLFLSTSLV